MSVAESSEVDASVWRAVAGTSVHIPQPNTYSYYFPQGHLEQESPQSGVDRTTTTTNELPIFLCRVLAVKFLVDPATEELFARITLLPIQNNPNGAPYDTRINSGNGDYVDLAMNSGVARQNDDVISYSKTLTASDANNGGGFSVPRFCADSIFPKLDLGADPPVQNLSIFDINNKEWIFRHIYRGTPRRHLLTTGWSKFVNTKLLMSGDSVVFMKKKSTGELFAGVRRGGAGRRTPEASSGGGCGFLSDFNGLLGKAARGQRFDVVYRPRGGVGPGISPPFVVAAERVEEAVARMCWRPGMRVRMYIESNDMSRLMGIEGSVVAVNQGSSPWKMLQITWDEPSNGDNPVRVNPWEVECVLDATTLQAFAFPPLIPLTKKLRLTPPPSSINNGGGGGGGAGSELLGFHFPATQFAHHHHPSLYLSHAGPSFSELLRSPVEQREPSTTMEELNARSPADQTTLRLSNGGSGRSGGGGNGGSTRTFRLFGADIEIGGGGGDRRRAVAFEESPNAEKGRSSSR